MGDQLLDRRSNHQSVHALDRLSPPPAAHHLIATMEANQIGALCGYNDSYVHLPSLLS